MALLEYNEITIHRYIVEAGEPFEIIDSHVFRKQQRKPVNAVKMKSLINGRLVEKAYHPSDKAEEADIERQKIKYLYTNRGEFWFCEEKDPSKRFKLEESLIGVGSKFLKPNSIIEVKLFNENIFGIILPPKVELKVTDAPPAVRGDTAKGGNKTITLETGATITAPMFVAEGDVVRINTETGEYVERI